jgi:hypothetical protein
VFSVVNVPAAPWRAFTTEAEGSTESTEASSSVDTSAMLVLREEHVAGET